MTDSTNRALTQRMRVTFADAELEAKEGLYEIGTVATVRVQLSRPRNKESTVTIPITVTRHGTTTAADYAGADIPSSSTFLPGQTEYSFRVRAVNDDIDDDDEYLTLSFGTLPELVYAGDTSSVRINLVDNDDPPVQVSFEQANYEVTSTYREGSSVYARVRVTVKLSALPERFVDVGIVAESIRGGGDIYLGSSAYIPPRAAQRRSVRRRRDEIHRDRRHERRGRVRPQPDLPAQVRRHVLPGIGRESGNGHHHDKCKSLSRIGIAMLLRKAGVPAAAWLHYPPKRLRQTAAR